MTRNLLTCLLALYSLCFFSPPAATAQTPTPIPVPAPRPDVITSAPRLRELVNAAARAALARFAAKGLREENLAVTLVDLRDPARPVRGSFRGDEPIYPASVVKLFYLAAAHRWLGDGKLKETEELKRAMRDMIVESSNDATHYVVDVLSGTSNGAELAPVEMQDWAYKRNAVNRHFAALGDGRINVNQKPW
ncbi:MAG: hypothetical protein ACRD68_13125, partial [Pyrinomonadaceae bacterium]